MPLFRNGSFIATLTFKCQSDENNQEYIGEGQLSDNHDNFVRIVLKSKSREPVEIKESPNISLHFSLDSVVCITSLASLSDCNVRWSKIIIVLL